MINAQGRDRFKLYPVSEIIVSSYSERPLVGLTGGKACPDVVDALEALAIECPWLRVTDLWRDIATQTALRRRYDFWVASGKPTGTSYDPRMMKRDYVATPGKSMHNGGRAVDLNTGSMLNALGGQYLDAFWPTARRHGFTPIIAAPTEGVSESWHFDHKGIWQRVFDTLGYEQGILAANCAVGGAGSFQSPERRVQAHIVRLGKNIGDIDGNLGPRSRSALTELGIGAPLVESTKPIATRVQSMTTIAELLESM